MEKWDMGIFFTPCTFSCNSGIRHMYNEDGSINRERYEQCRYFAGMLEKCLNSDIPLTGCENPIPHKYALKFIGRKYDQIIQPWQFGHPEKKATCLWLKGLPLLTLTNNVYSEMIALPKNQQQKMFHLPPSKDRAKLRSKTYPGIAQAMADQWGGKHIITQPVYRQLGLFAA